MGYFIDDLEEPRDANVVSDENAPELFSQGAIWGFSVALTPLFGGILLALNLKTINKSNKSVFVIGFGLLSTILISVFLDVFPAANKNSMMVFLLNALCTLVFQYYYWPKYIGKETTYRKRKIWWPLLIGILICALFLLPILLKK